MKTWGSGGIALPFLTSGLDGGEWSASRSGCFTPGEIYCYLNVKSAEVIEYEGVIILGA
jgi:hypothetical protein